MGFCDVRANGCDLCCSFDVNAIYQLRGGIVERKRGRTHDTKDIYPKQYKKLLI